MGTTVGDLNGKWSLLFRASLIMLPFAIAWGVWVTQALTQLRVDMTTSHAKVDVWIATTSGNRFTIHDWNRLHGSNPHDLPRWASERLDRLDREMRDLHERVERVE